MTNVPKRPRDPNQLAKRIVDLATMDEEGLRALREGTVKKPKAPSSTGRQPRDRG